jgi:hypothetical protein
MLALLLALSPGAVAMQASAPMSSASDAVAQSETSRIDNDSLQTAPDGNTTTVMTLGADPARTGFDSPSLSLGDSLMMDRDGFKQRLSITELDQQLATAETDEQKSQILNRYRYRTESRIISLQAREERATNAFSNGTISEREYLTTLGRISVAASDIETVIDALNERSQSTRFSFDDDSLKAKMAPIQGPVRDQIADAIRGSAHQATIYVETADTGIVLSTIVNGQYVREVYRADNRDPSAQPSITVKEANEEVIQSRYPWISEPNQHWTGSERLVYRPIQVVRADYEYSHGNLTAYVDTGTAEVYREIQHKRLTGENSLPPGPGVVNASENLTLTVNRTYPGGPLRVKLTNETGAPLRSQVTVAGESVGRTNAEGILWTLGPVEQFEVTATHEDATVNVTATPVDGES